MFCPRLKPIPSSDLPHAELYMQSRLEAIWTSHPKAEKGGILQGRKGEEQHTERKQRNYIK